MAQINKLNVSAFGEWYCVYNDTDSMTDYFHSVRGTQKYMTRCLIEDGADIISVSVTNDNLTDALKKALFRLAKNINYTLEFKDIKRTTYDGMDWIDHTAVLTREVKQ